MCRWLQISLMLIVITFFVLDVALMMSNYQKEEYVALSRECDADHPQFNVNLSSTEEPGNVNGSLRAGDLTFPADAYWHHDDGSTWGCPCLLKTCVVKCCPRGQRLSSKTNLTCVADNSTSSLFLYNFTVFYKLKHHQRLDDLHPKPVENSGLFFIPGIGCKRDTRYGSRYEIKDNMFLVEDGSLLTKELLYLDLDGYCVDGVSEGDQVVTLRCVENTLDYLVNQAVTGVRYVVVEIVLAVSVSCLLATLAVYAVVPRLRNLHGKMLICYLACLTLYYSSAILREANITLLNVLQFLLQFSRLSWFSWLTAMCFNIWSVFSQSLLPLSARPPRREFLLYSAFAWGCPLVFCVLTAAVGVVPDRLYSDSCPKPRFQYDDGCFFNSERTSDLFLYFPIVLLSLLNLVMFLSTMCNIRWVHFRASGDPPDLARRAKEDISLYIRLALVMGFNWIVITVCYAGNDPLYFFFARVVESSQGIVLFLVLVCNKRVQELLNEKVL